MTNGPVVEPVAALERADALHRAGRYRDAAALLQELATAEPPDAAALRRLGLSQLRLGQGAAALANLARAHALAPQDPLAGLHLGLALQTAGRHAEALPLLRAAFDALPQDPAPAVNLSAALLALGETGGALHAASEACHRAPQLAEAHYAYGSAWLACGEPARAAAAFADAVRLRRDFAEAWVNLGLAHYQGGDLRAAEAATRAALQAAPWHRAASANLATFLRLTGRAEAAERLLRDLLAHDPGAIEARLALAGELLSLERSAEALALLDAAGPPSGRPAVAQHLGAQRVAALLQLGRVAEARAGRDGLGEPLPGMQAILLWRDVVLAQAEGLPARASEAAAAMAAALRPPDPSTVPEHRIIAHFNLGRFWSGTGDLDRAFPHWVEGHRQLRRFQPFRREEYQAFVEGSIAAFSKSRLHHGARAGNADPAAVFVAGLPRSGTTLCEQILAAHPEMHGAGERDALSATFARLGGARETAAAAHRVASLDAADLDAAAARYLAELHALAPAARRVVDKMPGNLRHLGLVGLMLPGARVIHCVRDPRDVGLSIFTHRFHGHHPYAHDLGDLGWYIVQQTRLMQHWREVLPVPVLPIALRDWVEDFEGTLARVLRFLDLPDHPACRAFHTLDRTVRTASRSQVRKPINARGLDRWQAYAHHLPPLLAALQAGGVIEADDGGS